MPGRKYIQPNSNYRYGFNGKENDNEVKGEGNQQDYGMRIYDPRLGRFQSVDPLASSFPHQSPYTAMDDNPINKIDPTGMAATDWVGKKGADGNTTWSWNDNVHSADEAKAAGYDDYKAPGSRLENARIGSGPSATVYLGHSAKEVGYDESTFTNWNNVNGTQYDNRVDAYRAWQGDPNYHMGEGFWDKTFRGMAFGSMEARRDYASGGSNMFGGYGAAAKLAPTGASVPFPNH